jgi:hypothetical protein
VTNARPSRLLRFSAEPGVGLRIAPRRERRSLSLVFGADHAEAQYQGCGPVVLQWSDFGAVPYRYGVDQAARDRWAISFWSVSRVGPIGIALSVSGHVESACHDLSDATMTRWRRYEQWWLHTSVHDPHSLPVVPASTIFGSPRRDITTLNALAQVLANYPQYRERLAKPERAARLAADLAHGVLDMAVAKGGMRRDTTDIIVALRKAGFFHSLGRPLSREDLPAPEKVLASVRAHLDANPFRRGRHSDDETIMRVINAVYLDAEPWPFAALID